MYLSSLLSLFYCNSESTRTITDAKGCLKTPIQFWSKIRLPNCRKGVVCYTIVVYSSRMYICTYICSLWGKTIHTCHYYISAISSSICTMYCFSFTYIRTRRGVVKQLQTFMQWKMFSYDS